MKILFLTIIVLLSSPSISMGLVLGEDNSEYSVSSVSTWLVDHPLKQYLEGVSVKNIACDNGLQLVIKAEDGFPACVKSDTARQLIIRGWAEVNSTVNSYAENTTGNDTVVTIDNQTFYQKNLGCAESISNATSIEFHNIYFTIVIKSKLDKSLNMDVVTHFPDKSVEHLPVDVQYCTAGFTIPEILLTSTNHNDPAAGISVGRGLVKLLVSKGEFLSNDNATQQPLYGSSAYLAQHLPAISEENNTKAVQVALSDRVIKNLIDGRTYKFMSSDWTGQIYSDHFTAYLEIHLNVENKTQIGVVVNLQNNTVLNFEESSLVKAVNGDRRCTAGPASSCP